MKRNNFDNLKEQIAQFGEVEKFYSTATENNNLYTVQIGSGYKNTMLNTSRVFKIITEGLKDYPYVSSVTIKDNLFNITLAKKRIKI